MKTGIQIAFGKAVRTARLRKKWTQEDLADRAKLHPTYISDVERGERNLSLENIVALANALGLKTHELFRTTAL